MSSPRLLVIDTSGAQAGIELWSGPSQVASQLFGTARHAHQLAGQLRALLHARQLKPANIDAIAINIGPGSFTGIRVGLAMAKAMIYVDGQKLIGIDAFDAWAAGVAPHLYPEFTVVTEGQMQTANIVNYRHNDARYCRGELMTVPRDQLAGTCADRTTVAVGDRMQSLLPQCIQVQPRLAAVALARFAAGHYDDPLTLEPYYVRPSSAEEKWDAR